MVKIAAVIFDMDGTLLEWQNPNLTFEQLASAQFGLVHRTLIERGYALPDTDHFSTALYARAGSRWQEAVRREYQPVKGQSRAATVEKKVVKHLRIGRLAGGTGLTERELRQKVKAADVGAGSVKSALSRLKDAGVVACKQVGKAIRWELIDMGYGEDD